MTSVFPSHVLLVFLLITLQLCRITFYFQLFPLFLHIPSTSCPLHIPVAFLHTICGIFLHSLSLFHLSVCRIVLILFSLQNFNSLYSLRLLFFTSIITHQILNYMGLKHLTEGLNDIHVMTKHRWELTSVRFECKWLENGIKGISCMANCFSQCYTLQREWS